MDNSLQIAIENLKKTLNSQSVKLNLIISNLQITKLSNLGETITDQIGFANQDLSEYLKRFDNLGDNLRAITENWQSPNISESMENKFNNLGIKGKIDSSAGIPNQSFNNCSFLDDQNNDYNFCLN